MWRMTALAGALILAACGHSPETHYYALDPVAPPSMTHIALSAPIKVDAVHIPAALDRLSIVRGEMGNELDISDRDRWGAPVGDMARRVLTQDLTNRLGPNGVLPPDAPTPDNTRGLVVDIAQFEPDSSGQVVLDANWSLVGKDMQPLRTQSLHLTEMAAEGAGGEAAAMSRLLGQLADRIASTVVAMDGSGGKMG